MNLSGVPGFFQQTDLAGLPVDLQSLVIKYLTPTDLVKQRILSPKDACHHFVGHPKQGIRLTNAQYRIIFNLFIRKALTPLQDWNRDRIKNYLNCFQPTNIAQQESLLELNNCFMPPGIRWTSLNMGNFLFKDYRWMLGFVGDWHRPLSLDGSHYQVKSSFSDHPVLELSCRDNYPFYVRGYKCTLSIKAWSDHTPYFPYIDIEGTDEIEFGILKRAIQVIVELMKYNNEQTIILRVTHLNMLLLLIAGGFKPIFPDLNSAFEGSLTLGPIIKYLKDSNELNALNFLNFQDKALRFDHVEFFFKELIKSLPDKSICPYYLTLQINDLQEKNSLFHNETRISESWEKIITERPILDPNKVQLPQKYLLSKKPNFLSLTKKSFTKFSQKFYLFHTQPKAHESKKRKEHPSNFD